MNHLIQDKEHVFMHRDTKRVHTDIRQQFYYDAYNLCQGPTPIQKFLKDNYNFSVNQSTIYHSWYKIKKKMQELTPEGFMEKYFRGTSVDVAKMMDAYAAYQLGLHVYNPTQPERRRMDIGRKINELKERASK
jgi:hypothetical protein